MIVDVYFSKRAIIHACNCFEEDSGFRRKLKWCKKAKKALHARHATDGALTAAKMKFLIFYP